MKKFALITSLLLGAAPLAQAQTWGGDYQPGDYDRSGDYERHGDYDHYRRGMGYRANQDQTVRLFTLDLSHSQTFDFPRNAGRFQTLRLHALKSAGYVDFVEVRYGNGEQQHVDVKHVIGRDEDIDINVGGRHVEAITVHGSRNPRDRWAPRARIEVIGMR